MAEPIASLTREQMKLLPEFVEGWRKTALMTARVDASAARRAVRELYCACGLREPRAVICLDSPIACLIARAILVTLVRHTRRYFPSSYVSFYDRSLHKYLYEDLDEPLSIRVWRATWAQLQEQIGEAQWRPLVAQLSDVDGTASALGHLVRGCVHEPVLDQLTPQLRARLGRLSALGVETGWPIRVPIDTQIHGDFRPEIEGRNRHRPGAFVRRELPYEGWQQACLVGGQEGALLALCDLFEHIGLQYPAKSKRQLEAYKFYARSCGWLYAFGSIAFVSDRPSELHFDAQRWLHHASGAAVRYRDGWSAYAWHGTGVPDWLIEQPDAITPADIENLAYFNWMQARAALEIYGFGRYLTTQKLTVIAADELHGQPRRLLELSVGGYQFRVIAVVNGSREQDGTRRRFHLAAMAGDTPAEVIAASYGITPAHYREAVRT